MIKKLIVGQFYKWLHPDTCKDRVFKVLGYYNRTGETVFSIKYMNPPYFKIGDLKICLDGKNGVLEIRESFINENLNNLELVNVKS